MASAAWPPLIGVAAAVCGSVIGAIVVLLLLRLTSRPRGARRGYGPGRRRHVRSRDSATPS